MFDSNQLFENIFMPCIFLVYGCKYRKKREDGVKLKVILSRGKKKKREKKCFNNKKHTIIDMIFFEHGIEIA